MSAQEDATFGSALKEALRAARSNQAALARVLSIDPGQVSRWVNNKAMPHGDTVTKIEEYLDADLSDAFTISAPNYELYVSAPITGLGRGAISAHHDAVSEVVDSLRNHVNSFYWPGAEIRNSADLVAPDIATERNMMVIAHCSAFLYLQFAEITRPSSALIELGFALGRRLKTTIIQEAGIRQPYMFDGFGAVAASLSFLPKARMYTVTSVEDACDLVKRNGRELLGLS